MEHAVACDGMFYFVAAECDVYGDPGRSMPSNTLFRTFAISLLLIAAGCDRQPNSATNPPPETPRSTERPKAAATENPSGFLPPSKKDRNRPDVVPSFSNVAETSGINFTFFSDIVPGRFLLPEIMGGGASWFDFDGDGLFDLYLMNGCSLDSPDTARDKHFNRLYRNLGDGRFEERSRLANTVDDSHYGQGVTAGDFDADGFMDLYLANYGANILLHNNGDGTFSDVTEWSGAGDSLWSTSPIWLDVDGDHDLDLYVTNYLLVTLENIKVCEYDGVVGYCGPGSYEAAPDHVFLNQGDGTFRESAEQLGLVQEGGKGLAIAALDFDHDLRPEIYVANDMMENFLFSREKTDAEQDTSDEPAANIDNRKVERRRYANIAVPSGCAVSLTGIHEASMGVSCADFDGDQLPDIFVTHYYANKNTLYHNLGELMFHDDSRRTRIAATSYETLGFGTIPFDYDRDGATDLFITNGHVLGPNHKPNEMPPQLLRNDGRGSFVDISHFGGPYFNELWLGRGAAGGDYDNDGDLDLVVTHIGQPVALLSNETRTDHHWLGIELRTISRVKPIGGRVVVRADQRTITLPVVAGGSYLCDGDPRLLIGLGDHSEPVTVEIYWPSGQRDVHPNLAVDRYWRLGETIAPPPSTGG